jgi:hypothetical protein
MAKVSPDSITAPDSYVFADRVSQTVPIRCGAFEFGGSVAALGVVPEHVGSSGPPWRLSAVKGRERYGSRSGESKR